jgi:hypothetical protein
MNGDVLCDSHSQSCRMSLRILLLHDDTQKEFGGASKRYIASNESAGSRQLLYQVVSPDFHSYTVLLFFKERLDQLNHQINNIINTLTLSTVYTSIKKKSKPWIGIMQLIVNHNIYVTTNLSGKSVEVNV